MNANKVWLKVGFLPALFLSLGQFEIQAAAAENAKPATVIVSDGVTTSGYMQSMAIAETLKSITQQNFEIKPEASGLTRLKLLISQEADYCACGMDSYFAQEGLLQFETPKLGPQPLRIILSSSSDFHYNLAIAKDSKAKTLSDLTGKRIAWIRGADQLNANTTAFLSYANIGWSDVQKMTYPGYNEALEGFFKKQIDAIIVSGTSPKLDKIMSGRRKAFLPAFNSKNRLKLGRIKDVAPYLSPVTTFSKPNSWSGLSHPYPILLTTAHKSEDEVYALTKAMSENLDAIQEHTPSAEGWNLSWQNLTWVMPYHNGAIRYFQEVGIWSDAAQFHQLKLVKRQNALIAAFKSYNAANPDKESFVSGWRYTREITLADE